MVSFYFKNCPNCKNAERNLVRECALQAGRKIDERYILALPDIWGEEAAEIGETLPFLYDDASGSALHIDHNNPNMASTIKEFLTGSRL